MFEPIDNVLTSFTAQFIRLLYPCILNYKNGVIITDMDMIPMNRTYYTENIKSFDNNKFIYFRENVLFEHKQLAMCYNVAVPKIWKDIFKINSHLIELFPGNNSNTDYIRFCNLAKIKYTKLSINISSGHNKGFREMTTNINTNQLNNIKILLDKYIL